MLGKCGQGKSSLVVFGFLVEADGLQAVVGTAGGATRAALVQHQARRDNMADVAAKDGSQVTTKQL